MPAINNTPRLSSASYSNHSDSVSAGLRGRQFQAVSIANYIGAAADKVATGYRAIMASWNRQKDVNRAYAWLSRLDDRMLADIGIDRTNLLVSLQNQQNRIAVASDADFNAPQRDGSVTVAIPANVPHGQSLPVSAIPAPIPAPTPAPVIAHAA